MFAGQKQVPLPADPQDYQIPSAGYPGNQGLVSACFFEKQYYYHLQFLYV